MPLRCCSKKLWGGSGGAGDAGARDSGCHGCGVFARDSPGAALPETPPSLRPIFQIVELGAVRNTEVAGWLKNMFKDRLVIQEDSGQCDFAFWLGRYGVCCHAGHSGAGPAGDGRAR